MVSRCLGEVCGVGEDLGRKEYWYFLLFFALINATSFCVGFPGRHLQQSLSNRPIHVGLYDFDFLPWLALSVRRLHDIGYSGHWLWVIVLGVFAFAANPAIGLVIIFVLSSAFAVAAMVNSDSGPNQFGPHQNELCRHLLCLDIVIGRDHVPRSVPRHPEGSCPVPRQASIQARSNAQCSEDPYAGEYDGAEYTIGLGFVACQQYMTCVFADKSIDKRAVLELGPRHACGVTYAALVNAAANTWKHYANGSAPGQNALARASLGATAPNWR